MARFDPTTFLPSAEKIALFWSRVAKRGPNDCWLWQAGRSHGYGAFQPVCGVYVGAHRLSWILTYGPVPRGLYVCHDCPGGDNKACCNPAHLFLGTNTDNQLDAADKGQTRTGERHHRHKLTAVVVRTMRARHARGVSAAALARRHGISVSQAKRVVRRQSWRQVA